jgi:lipooligosaccharide transport system permease protein
VTTLVITPLFLVAGTFFPIEGLPEWAQVVAQLNPLYHLVQLVRDAVVFGFEPADLVHLGVLIAFGLLTWRLAVRWLAKRLID